MSLSSTRRFGRYELSHLVGEGGMAEVYKASVEVAEGLSKWVVIKRIRQEYADRREFTRMFVEEAKIALSLNHANIVQVFDFGQVDGVFYLAMELIEGIDLMKLFHAVQGQGGTFSDVMAAYLGHQIASGLAYAHRKKDDYGTPLDIVHRDVSPHNVMLSFDGQVKVLDFGIARARAAPRGGVAHGEGEGSIKGKIAYMSPEQARGDPLDARADIYSLGVLLYELLTGTLLFRDKDRLAALERVRTEPIPPLLVRAPEVPDELARIVDRALARAPEDRFPSAREFQAALAAFLHRSDPIVDDEYLRQYLEAFREDDPTAIQHPEGAEMATKAFLDGEQSAMSQVGLAAASRRVVVVHASLNPTASTPALESFLDLARDIAFKREAHVHHATPSSLVLVFGSLLSTSEDPDRALRVARTLREVIGDAAPGVAIGTVIMEAYTRVERISGGGIHVMLPEGMLSAMEACARQFMDDHIVVSGAAIERLSKSWRFGETSLPSRAVLEGSAGSPWAAELQQLAPCLGPRSSQAAAQLGARGLFGRELELKSLNDALRETIRRGASRSVVIEGEAGIGKRTLLEHFLGELPPGSCAVFRGVGQWRRRNEPFGVFWAMLRRFLLIDDQTRPEQLARRLSEHGVAEAETLVGILGDVLGLSNAEVTQVTPDAFRELSARLIRRLIRAVARQRPALVVIENLEFVDQETLDLLRWWSFQRADVPILGLVTSRPSPRVRQLVVRGHTHVLPLRPFGPRSCREFILRRFEIPEDAHDLAEALAASTGGHPLFIEEMLAALIHRGVLAWGEDGQRLVVHVSDAPLELPPSMEHALAHRLDELEPEEREILLGAAVLGRTFRVRELEVLMTQSIDATLANLERQGLVSLDEGSDPPTATFTTLSFHEVCKQRPDDGRAAELHGRAAQLKLHRPDYAVGRDDGPIADHLLAAKQHFEAVEPGLRAAAHALRMGASVEAHYHLTHALNGMQPEDPRKFDALLEREMILRAWGRRRAQGADIRQLVAIAERRGVAALEVRAAIRLLRFYLDCGRASRGAVLAPRIEERIGAIEEPAPYLAALRELQSELHMASGALDDAQARALAGLDICDRFDVGAPQRCRLLACLGRMHSARGQRSMAEQSFTKMLTLAREAKHPRLEAEALNSLGGVAGRRADYQAAVDYFRASIAIDRDLGDRATTGIKLANLGITFAAIGLYRRAERYLRRALDLHEVAGHAGLLNDAVIHLGEVVGELHDFEGARQILLDAAEVARQLGDARSELRAKNRLARILLHEGTDASLLEARALAREVLDRAANRPRPLRSASCRALQILAAVCGRRGDLHGAIMHAREATILVRAGAAPVDGVLALHHLGVLLARAGRDRESAALLAEAGRAVQRRLAGLHDPTLRRGYMAQAAVARVLDDAGLRPPG